MSCGWQEAKHLRTSYSIAYYSCVCLPFCCLQSCTYQQYLSKATYTDLAVMCGAGQYRIVTSMSSYPMCAWLHRACAPDVRLPSVASKLALGFSLPERLAAAKPCAAVLHCRGAASVDGALCCRAWSKYSAGACGPSLPAHTALSLLLASARCVDGCQIMLWCKCTHS